MPAETAMLRVELEKRSYDIAIGEQDAVAFGAFALCRAKGPLAFVVTDFNVAFLASGWLRPTFPPTALSTMDRRVVGTMSKGRPRANVAATKPARSPITPPPTATIIEFRSA
jgi:hypothetical protein